MHLPQWKPGRVVEHDRPNFQSRSQDGGIGPQFGFPFPIPIPGVDRCATECIPRAGYVACVARCKVDGCICDGGVDNCRC